MTLSHLEHLLWNLKLLKNDFLDFVVPQRRLNRRFLQAIDRMKPDELTDWLACGADPNAHDLTHCALGRTARALFTDTALAKILLEAGADPNGPRTPEMWPPLVEASHSSTDEEIQLLLEAGANPALVNCRGLSVLDELTRWASLETIQKAIDYGATMHLGAPLCFAVNAGRLELVRLFLERGADPLARESYTNKLPLEVAQERGEGDFKFSLETNQEIVALLEAAMDDSLTRRR
jgi:ankyrin repeat protein